MEEYNALTVKQQIEVLKSAKKLYIEKVKKGIYYNCMCYCLSDVIEKQRKIDDIIFGHQIVCFIPSFNVENIELAGIKGYVPLVKSKIGWWWNLEDTTIRPIVFDYLISELEKELV